MPYRFEHITADDRMEIGCVCLLGAGEYGLMTQLAQELGVSRQFLFKMRARTRAVDWAT